MIRLDRDEARRIAIRAQLLDARRPDELLPMVNHLMFLQLDPTAAVAPTADLVAYTRLSNTYHPEHLTAALEQDRTLFELTAMVRPMADLKLYLADMAAWPRDDTRRDWLKANDKFRRFVLDLLQDKGPLLSKEVPDRAELPWPSTGWTNNRNVTQLLEFLVSRGEVAIAGRQGRQRLWDVADRVYPAGTEAIPAQEAKRLRDERRLKALGIARSSMVGEAGEPAQVDGTRGEWRVDPTAVDQPFEGRTALLSPFDRLVHDRVRLMELFDFEYGLEMYKPKAKRRWGYFALPVLFGDRLVGKVDATADRKAGVLRVDAVHEDEKFRPEVADAVDAELAALAGWIGCDRVTR